jgi:putative ABC transport system permease protein
MIKNYIKIAIRNISRSKIYSFINIIGLAVSISACVLISLWVLNELSYDKFNKNADRVYRLYSAVRMSNQDKNAIATPAPLGETLYKDLPEVESFARISLWSHTPVVRFGSKVSSEKRFLLVDSTFFKIFTAEFIQGDPETAINRPNTIVLTESTARKYFGNGNPTGQMLNVDKNINYIVTGVIKDFPEESHIHFDFLGSLSTLEYSKDKSWINDDFYTYILLKKGVSQSEFQKKLNTDVRKYIGVEMKAQAGISLEQFEAAGNRYGFCLQPLKSIHLHSHMGYEIEPNNDISYVYIFSAIAIAILLIACINFINLSTARSERRAKEVGIRKTLGSHKLQIAIQFIIESILTSFVAVIISIGIVELLLPYFNNIADKKLLLNPFGSVNTILLLTGFTIVIGLIAGSYPAFYLSSFRPVQVFKSDIRKGSRKAALRSGLVIFQFAISIVLIIGTFVIYSQLKYMQNKNLGFNKGQVLVINKAWNLGNQMLSFKHDLMKNPDIINVSNSGAVPGDQQGGSAYRLKNSYSMELVSMHQMWCDYDFKNTYQMKIHEGRFFSEAYASDTSAVIINESAARMLGVKQVDGKFLTDLTNIPNFRIIGIIKDFNYSSLHETIVPLAIFLSKPGNSGKFLSIRIKTGNYKETMAFIESVWRKYAGNEVLEYGFLDHNLQKLYLSDQRTSKIAAIFSFLAIFIACLGLFGLATFITEQRTKEIGIRKVLGATIPELITLLFREFAKWVLIANLIAWPVAYYFMNKWLQDFAYRINISIWTFIISGAAALTIAILTVSANAVKAATANPVRSLKYE